MKLFKMIGRIKGRTGLMVLGATVALQAQLAFADGTNPMGVATCKDGILQCIEEKGSSGMKWGITVVAAVCMIVGIRRILTALTGDDERSAHLNTVTSWAFTAVAVATGIFLSILAWNYMNAAVPTP